MAAALTRRARANDVIRAAIRADPADRLPFACECGAKGCTERVWVTLRDFDLHRRLRRPMFADHGARAL